MSILTIFLYLILSMKAEPMLIETQKKILMSINEELSVKHHIFIKDSIFQVKPNIISWVKYLSSISKVYVSFLTADQMIFYMDEYFFYDNRTVLEYHKTMVLLSEAEIASLIKERNEYAVQKLIWIIFEKSNQSIKQRSHHIYVPYNCQFLIVRNDSEYNYVITEIYNPKIGTSVMHESYFGKWTERAQWEIQERDFNQRRLDMNGTILKFVTDMELDVKYVFEDFNLEIISEISRIMNIRLERRYSSNVNDLYVEQAKETKDLNSINEIFLSNFVVQGIIHRQKCIWTYFRKETIHFLIRSEKNYDEYDAFAYLRPFATDLWLAIIAWVIVSGTVLLIIEVIIKKPLYKLQLFHGFIRSVECFINQEGAAPLVNLSFRIAVLSIKCVAFWVFQSYSAQIIFYILDFKVNPPFSSSEEFVKDGTFKIINKNSSIFWAVIKDDPWLMVALEKLRALEDIDGKPAEILCSSKNKLTKISGLQRVLYDFPKSECKILILPNPLFEFWKILPLRDQSPYEKIFNRIMKSLYSAGIIKRWRQKLEHDFMFNLKENISWGRPKLASEREFVSVQYENTFPIFMLISFLYIFALVILVLECLYKN